MQKQVYSVDRLIGYRLQILNNRETNLHTTHRECLGAVWPILLPHPYLEANRFTARPDHDASEWIFNLADAAGLIARWIHRLIECNLKSIHSAVVKHSAGNALWRLETKATDDSVIEDDIHAMATTTSARSRQKQLVDTTLERTLKKIKKSTLPTLEERLSAQNIDAYWDKIQQTVGTPGLSLHFDKNGLLERLSPIDGTVQNDVLHSMRPVTLKLDHDATLSGPQEECQMYDTIRREYVWPNMSTDVYSTVRHYQDCP